MVRLGASSEASVFVNHAVFGDRDCAGMPTLDGLDHW